MEFNPTTFTLELINFLILIWILQRLFYKPVRNIIEQRKQHIRQSLQEAKQLREEAEVLRKDYGNRLQKWEQEKQLLHSQLQQQLEQEKQHRIQALQHELKQERDKANIAWQRQQQDLQRHQQQLALRNGSRFAALILRQAAGPELEKSLFDLLINQLTKLPELIRQTEEIMLTEQPLTIKVSSVYPLSQTQIEQLEQKLTSLLDATLVFQYSQNAELIAGLKIDIESWVLNANLQHDLKGFAEIAYDF